MTQTDWKNWLYTEIAEQWAKFNLQPDSFETIKRLVKRALSGGQHQRLTRSCIDLIYLYLTFHFHSWTAYDESTHTLPEI